jgi:preprotein translocase subunit Sss1
MGTMTAHAQSMEIPKNTVQKLQKYKERTRAAVAIGYRKGKLQVECQPIVNRLLVLSTDEFIRASKKPTRDEYLRCIENGLARLALRTTVTKEREQIAEFYQDLMDIVGLETSEGRLDEFVQAAAAIAKQ